MEGVEKCRDAFWGGHGIRGCGSGNGGSGDCGSSGGGGDGGGSQRIWMRSPRRQRRDVSRTLRQTVMLCSS
ncbi:PREDICTED: membrane-associated phosphatidylinositol transfer protein 2-like [Atta colombica]|uniref:membrane-associated phosphatidylinositol transfer protein 2-like n=1 Tax=Atta colombica TaxID=520822 RepID=UPI00084CCCE2|nr:PREDICTED: membrane-associated phosphatidylinositol transfer protein 2-like [Atta colombica]